MFNYFISHTYMYARNHCFSLFRMKIVADLRMLINGYKKDVSEDGSLLAPDVTNGLVLYINSNLKNAKPVEIARIVAKLAPRQDVNINALCASIKRVLQTINDMKKHLDRAWEDVVCFLKLKLDLPLNESVTKKQNPHASASVVMHTSQSGSSGSITLNSTSGCTKCGEIKTSLRKLIASNNVLKVKLRLFPSVKMKNKYLQNALRRKSNIEDTLPSKLLSAKRTINTNNSKINKLKLENFSLKQGQGSESRQLKRSLVALRYKYYKSKISYKIHEQKWKKENKELKEKIRLMSIEKKLRCVVEMEHNLLNEFPELSPHQVSIILKVLSDTSSILGLYFEHLWYVNEKNVLYNGHVVSVKPLTKSKVPKVIVFYWKSDEDEEDGENVTMTVYGLLADYIAGDLNLSELNT